MKYATYILLCFLIFNISRAQPGKEAWHWQFGVKCALDFSSGVPVAGTSVINTLEGSASVSDPNTGQLLFYTDGETVYDRNNNQMPNGFGLKGSYSSPQTAIIFPWPGHPGLYYIITADQNNYLNANMGVNYSVVDISQNGGLGDVVTKNILLTPPLTTENCIAIKHCNNVDYWVITHTADTDIFNAYLFSASGVNHTPVQTHIGSVQVSGNISTCMKASPDCKKIVTGSWLNIEMFDFDRLDGTLYNLMQIQLTPNLDGYAYGLSFSPDSRKLYVAIPDAYRLYQFDLSNYTQTSISASKTLVANNRQYHFIQLGPDGKIYVNGGSPHSLSVINNPNASGLNCNFQEDGVPLLPSGDSVLMGLPTFLDFGYNFASSDTFIYSYSIKDTSVCKGQNVTFTASNYFPNWSWSNGISANSITVHDTGKYTATHVQSNTCIEQENFYLHFKKDPVANLGSDTMFFCTGSKILSSINPNSTYLWSTGSTFPSITVNAPGTYWLQVTENGCKASDTMKVLADTSQHSITFPNVVTPNGDGINDAINFAAHHFSFLHVEIYNRWGKKIFESDDTSAYWQPNDTNSVDGTYYFLAQYEIDCTGSTVSNQVKGFITVIR
jgi:gliding motility-associated-like protein